MNNRDELLEVMARAANPDTWYWQPRFDAPGRLEYEAAYILRCKDIDIQRRALEAIEANGARVGTEYATADMKIAGGEAQQLCIGSYGEPGLVYEAAIAASPFAPEKK